MCLDCVVIDKAAEGYCCVDYICVEDKFRGKGIGKVLLDLAEEDAKKNGMKVITLSMVS